MAVVQHIVFLTSFVSVFATLIFGSRFLGQKLREAGYDISRLIVYGLDTPNTPPAHTSKDMAAILPDFVQDLLKQYGLTPSDVQAPLAILVTLATTFVLYKSFASGSSKRALTVSLRFLDSLTRIPNRTQACPRPKGVEIFPSRGEDHHFPQHSHVRLRASRHKSLHRAARPPRGSTTHAQYDNIRY